MSDKRQDFLPSALYEYKGGLTPHQQKNRSSYNSFFVNFLPYSRLFDRIEIK